MSVAHNGGVVARPVFVLHDHRKPRPHFDLRLEQDGALRSWAVPRGLPTDVRHDRLAVAVEDHDLDHATYTDEHKSIRDHGWWDLIDCSERRFVFDLHGERSVVRYALINTGRDWLLHLVKEQPGELKSACFGSLGGRGQPRKRRSH